MEQDRQLRDRFGAIDEAALKRLVEEKAQESTGLEFKSWGKDDHNKTNLAKVLSGFANGEGGICIWGIRESSGGAPRTAESLAPIENVARALDRLNDWTADATSPRHPNVYHEVIGGKFIKTLVLATDGQPVMARFGIDQYRVRVATRNMAMEHFQIADMFGRRSRPEICLQCTSVDRIRLQGRAITKLEIAIVNSGRAVARHYGVAVNIPDGVAEWPYGASEWLPSRIISRAGKAYNRVWRPSHPEVLFSGEMVRRYFFVEGHGQVDRVIFGYLALADETATAECALLVRLDAPQPS